MGTADRAACERRRQTARRYPFSVGCLGGGGSREQLWLGSKANTQVLGSHQNKTTESTVTQHLHICVCSCVAHVVGTRVCSLRLLMHCRVSSVFWRQKAESPQRQSLDFRAGAWIKVSFKDECKSMHGPQRGGMWMCVVAGNTQDDSAAARVTVT